MEVLKHRSNAFEQASRRRIDYQLLWQQFITLSRTAVAAIGWLYSSMPHANGLGSGPAAQVQHHGPFPPVESGVQRAQGQATATLHPIHVGADYQRWLARPGH
jgi:hypothetical protein